MEIRSSINKVIRGEIQLTESFMEELSNEMFNNQLQEDDAENMPANLPEDDLDFAEEVNNTKSVNEDVDNDMSAENNDSAINTGNYSVDNTDIPVD